MTPIALLAAILSAAPQSNPAITISVDANVNRTTIDSRIYGVAWADAATISDLDIPLNRWGGNAMSGYNWAYSTANRCKDYYFYSEPDDVSPDYDPLTGGSADDFIKASRDGGAQPVMTIPLMPLLPKDRTKRCSFPQATYNNQEDYSNPAWEPVVCGNGRTEDGNGNIGDGPRIIPGADPNHIYTANSSQHQADWVQHMIDTWGNANAGGMTYYSLDNEPMLWSFDHWDAYPTGASYDDVWGRMQEYGAAIRAKDPNAIITGGEEWGWEGYFVSGLDVENKNSADKDAHSGKEWYDYMLDQAKAYEDAHGVRIFDVLTVHFYPQGGEFSDDVSTDAIKKLRNRSTRSLWDPAYLNESWIGDPSFHDGIVQLIPRLKSWVANHYPGTKIGITEYNWGAENDINGATAQADILGILGRESVDMATRWEVPPTGSFVYNAFKMYRNYDGAHSKFGDMSVSATAPDVDNVAAFSALRASDNAMTVMLIAKTLSGSTPATVNLANFSPSSANAKCYQLTSSNAITHLADVSIAGSSLSLSLPAQSITLLVIPGPPAPPTPATFSATATSSSQVALSWSASSGANLYEIYRSVNHSAYTLLKTSTTTAATDSGLAADTTYLYKVRAMAGAAASAFTTVDPATTTIFADDPLNVGTAVKASHITQLRTAVNAMRAASGLTPQVFTDAGLTSGFTIRGVHLTDLRTALDQARTAIGIGAISYADSTITAQSTIVRAQHVIDLRNGVK